jgi:hypothetical protein
MQEILRNTMTPARIIDALRSHPLVAASAAVILLAIGVYQIVGPADNGPDELDFDDDFAVEMGLEPIGRLSQSAQNRDADAASGDDLRFGEAAPFDAALSKQSSISPSFETVFSPVESSEDGTQIRTAGFESNRSMRRPAAWLTGTIEDIESPPAVPKRTASSLDDGPASARY